jgi:hypothetical protein
VAPIFGRCSSKLAWERRAREGVLEVCAHMHRGAWRETLRPQRNPPLVAGAVFYSWAPAVEPKFICIIPVAMTESDADRFRQEAEECRKLAERARSQMDKEAWLRLAADWIKLAEDAELRRERWLGREE